VNGLSCLTIPCMVFRASALDEPPLVSLLFPLLPFGPISKQPLTIGGAASRTALLKSPTTTCVRRIPIVLRLQILFSSGSARQSASFDHSIQGLQKSVEQNTVLDIPQLVVRKGEIAVIVGSIDDGQDILLQTTYLNRDMQRGMK
jgi:hypothetical protein